MRQATIVVLALVLVAVPAVGSHTPPSQHSFVDRGDVVQVSHAPRTSWRSTASRSWPS